MPTHEECMKLNFVASLKVAQRGSSARHHMQTHLWENSNLNTSYPYIRDKTVTYLRYIDDLFFIWKGTEQKLLSIIEVLNKKHPSIKFSNLSTLKQRYSF